MLSIIIPVYNEISILKDTASKLLEFSEEFKSEGYEIVFSDDGSDDGSAEIIKGLSYDNPCIKSVLCRHAGKGSAVRNGVSASRGDMVLITDCDLAYGSEQMKAIIDCHRKNGAALTCGTRFKADGGYKGYSGKRQAGSMLLRLVIKLVCGINVSDPQTGIKCMDGSTARDLLKGCKTDGFAYDGELIRKAEKSGCKVEEYPVAVLEVNKRKSKVRPVKDALDIIFDLIKMRVRELK